MRIERGIVGIVAAGSIAFGPQLIVASGPAYAEPTPVDTTEPTPVVSPPDLSGSDETPVTISTLSPLPNQPFREEPDIAEVPTSPDGHSNSVWPADWSQLLSGLAATFVGALFGVWTAVSVDRSTQRRMLRRENIARAKEANEKLGLLAHEMRWNAVELTAILRDLEDGFRTDRAPLTDTWNAVGIDAPKLGGNAAIRLPEAYSLLRRCGRLLDNYASDLAQGGAGALLARQQTLPQLRAVIGDAQVALAEACEAVTAEQRSTD